MREILFRGETVRNEWITGLLAHIGNAWYISNKAGIATAYEVIPATIGEYTGLTDKDGVKIFEGDIVKGKVHVLCGYRIVKAVVIYDTADARFALEHGGEYKNIPFEREVIGNIHDNPELLEEG